MREIYESMLMKGQNFFLEVLTNNYALGKNDGSQCTEKLITNDTKTTRGSICCSNLPPITFFKL